MRTLPENLKKDTQAITQKIIRETMPEPKILHAEFCLDLKDINFNFSTTKHFIACGLELNFIKSLGMKVCKKSEAKALLVVGEKENDCFLINKTKRYWLTNI